MNNLTKSAREFLESILFKKENSIKEEHYFMFLISKFMLLKESIIKKDSSNDIIYFDYRKHNQYLPIILTIADYVLLNGEVSYNGCKITIKNSSVKDENIKRGIWIFNKIRDSFAHGMYSIDLEKKCIIIINDHSKDRNGYILKCEIPLELLELFTFLVDKKSIKNNQVNLNLLDEYRSLLRSNLNMSNDQKYNYDCYNYLIHSYIHHNLNIYKLNEKDKDLKEYISYKKDRSLLPARKSVDSIWKKSHEKGVLETLSNKELLSILFDILSDNKNLSKSQMKQIINYLKQRGLIQNDNSFVVKNDDSYKQKLLTIISEISTILGSKGIKNNELVIMALYNYMQLTFSFQGIYHRSMSKEAKKERFGYLKFSRIKKEYLEYFLNNDTAAFKENNESQYSLKVKAITNYCTIFVENIKERLSQYENHQNNNFRKTLMDSFSKFYDDIIDALASKNAFLVSSMRNAIEHANIYSFGNYVVLSDKNNQDDYKSTNFACSATVDDFYDITKTIELNNGKDEFTINDFLLELKEVVDINTYNNILVELEKLSMIIFGKELELDWNMEKMYIEAATAVLNAGIKR